MTDPVIRAGEMRLTEGDVAAAAQHFGLSKLTSLGGYENAVFRAEHPAPHIVRITHASRRSLSEVSAEMRFVEMLAEAGVAVAAPLVSRDGSLALALETEASGSVVVAATHVAPGRHRPPDEWSETDIKTYGMLVGRLHLVSRSLLSEPPLDRQTWDATTMSTVLADLGGRHHVILERVVAALTLLGAHPTGASRMLVHQDAHLGNLFVTDDGIITLFDFDDCGYATATYDLAMVLFYWFAGRRLLDIDAELRRFLGTFLEAYTAVYPLEDDWCAGADLYMQLRELELYAALVDHDLSDGWDRAFMDGRRERLDRGTPFFERPLETFL